MRTGDATIALVTGAGQGIGRAVALRLARDGASIVVNDVDSVAAEATAEAVRTRGGTAVSYSADVSDSRAVAGLAERVRREVGEPAVLVNNAATMTMRPLGELAFPEWRRVLATNLDGAFYCIRAVAPGMVRRHWGRIVNVASDWGMRGAAGASHYAASKGGLIALTKALARELGPSGITVNALAPGPVDTPQLEVDAAFTGVSLAEMRARYAAEAPLGRIGRPEEIASSVAYLVSDAAAVVTGQVLSANGGIAT